MRFLAASALCWSVARSCGVLVHNEVLHRSTHLFSLPNSVPDLTQLTPLISPLLLSPVNAPSLQAGAFFPDWGYQCLSTDSEAEAAHWPPFLVASVEHVISKYGYLNESTQRSSEEQEHLESLISFIFAIAAHQTQDATWHAIRLPTGFLAALAGVDFAGDFTKAHRVLDFGGDFMLATRLARMEEASKDWIRNDWKVPIKDIIAIYSRLGKDVNAFVLRYCTMRGLAALRSGLTVGPSLYDSMASQSPMFVSSLDDYYLGGLDEMTARTVSCWSNLTRWFAHGIDSDEKIRNGWGICDLFRAIKARGGAGESSDGAELNPSLQPTDIWGEGKMLQRSIMEFSKIQVQTDQFGAEIYTLPPIEEVPFLPSSSAPRPSHRELLSSSKAPKFSDPTYIATYTPYSHFGTSLSLGAFASAPGLAIAVGAPHETEDSSRPGEGNVYILPLSDILPSEPSPFSALQPEYVSPLQLAKPLVLPTTSEAGQPGVVDQRFGISSTAWHTLNTTLLAVAATGPLTYDANTPPSLPFRGTSSAGRIDVFRAGEPSRWLSLSIKGAELGSLGRRWWGEQMLSADIDGTGEWLVVAGGRGDGSRVCEGREKIQMGEGEVGVFQLVSSSSSSSDGVVQVELGIDRDVKTTTTAGITVNTYSIPLPATEKVGVPCGETNTYEAFGASVAFLKRSRTLLVGSPGAGGVGKVFAYRFVDGQFVNVFTIVSPTGPSTLRTGFGGSGMATGVTSAGQEWVAIGAGDEEVDGETQAGVVRVYVLDGEKEARLMGEVVAAATEDVEGRGGRKYGKFGHTIVADEVGGGVWVGSEYWAGETGGLWWLDIQTIISSSPESRVSRLGQKVLKEGGRFKSLEVKLQMQGEEPNARFAASLAVGEKGDLVVGIPYSGVSREDQGGRFYGAIGVYERK